MAKKHIKLVLKAGPQNKHKFLKKTTKTWNRGDVLKISGTKPGKLVQAIPAATPKSTGFLGVAAEKETNTTVTTKYSEVYVITSDQLWELHMKTAKKPVSYNLGENYKVRYTSNASASWTPDWGATAVTGISVKGPVLDTATAGSDGAVLVGYRNLGDKKGQKVLVRFPPGATVFKT